MKNLLTASASVMVLALAVPAFAGGARCSGGESATTADAQASCAGRNASAAWAGAWLQRSASGQIQVADVAPGSPAARAGLQRGDRVLAVNGYDLAKSEDRAMCASKAECNVGSAVTYKVQRGRSTRAIRLTLEKMPAHANERFASRKASFDPALAAMVMPAVH